MGWIKLVSTDDVEDEDVVGVEVDGKRFAVYSENGEYFVTGDICTHEFALLSEGYFDEGIIECPLHQAKFDVRSGKVLCDPAEKDIDTYPVKIEDGHVFIEII